MIALRSPWDSRVVVECHDDGTRITLVDGTEIGEDRRRLGDLAREVQSLMDAGWALVDATSRIAAMVESMPDDWKELLGRMEQRTREMVTGRDSSWQGGTHEP